MQVLVSHLKKRRFIASGVVILLALIAFVVSFTFEIEKTSYFNGKYNEILLYGLVTYKLIELPIIYYFLFHRYLNKSYDEEFFLKIKKHTKLLFFLIPQGNTIFGLIAYKLTGNIYYFLLFSLIAIITLILINPNRLKILYL